MGQLPISDTWQGCPHWVSCTSNLIVYLRLLQRQRKSFNKKEMKLTKFILMVGLVLALSTGASAQDFKTWDKVTMAYGDFRPLMTVLEVKENALKVWYLNFRLVKPKYITTEILIEDLVLLEKTSKGYVEHHRK